MTLTASEIDVAILCGGLGTRLRSVAADRPKPMVLVNDKPFLDILIRYLTSCGFRRFILCIGYKAETIRTYFRSTEDRLILFSEEKELLGTAGALKQASPLLQSKVLLVLNGDSFCPLDYRVFLQFHQQQDRLASLVLVKATDRTDGGFIELDENRRITSFREREQGENPTYMSAGIYLFDRAFFGHIPLGQKCSLEEKIFPSVLNEGIFGFVVSQKLHDIGTPERLEQFKKEDLWKSVQRST